MKKRHIALAAGLAFALLPVAGQASITSTKHNLSTSGTSSIKSTVEDEICAFCHTPHAADTGFTGAPLWNKQEAAGTTYTMYGTTIAGNSTDAAPNNPSKACLSCHDGVNAINSLVNAPGSGLLATTYNETLREFNASIPAGTALIMPDGVTRIGGGGSYTATNVDLSNDHPVSITYTVGAASLKDTNTTLSGWSGAATIADLLRSSKVECGSCHDPHESTNPTFLRKNNAGSALCLGCHNK